MSVIRASTAIDGNDELDFLLRPFKISLRLLRGSHAIGEVCACLRQTGSRLGLQRKQLAVLCVELAGPVGNDCQISIAGSLCFSHSEGSHLCLPGHVAIQRNWIVSLR